MKTKFLFHLIAFCALTFGTPQRAKAQTQNAVAAERYATSDTVIRIEANPAAGFNYAYFLRIPKGLNFQKVQYLLVETNNSGANDTMAHHEKETYLETIRNSLGSSLCKNLKVPFLIPIFPRPATEWQYYTHALDRDVAEIKEGEMKRLDLQLIAMIEDAKNVLKTTYGMAIQEKFLLNGFSASGTFANRFTAIHPDRVAGIACGGINAIPILCTPQLGKAKLFYPLGTSDFEKLFGKPFDEAAFQKVPHYIYMGENDTNDAALFDDAYSDSERKTIFKHIGKTMLPDRFQTCEKVYLEHKVNCTFVVYPGIGHQTDLKVFDDVMAFFTRIMEEQ